MSRQALIIGQNCALGAISLLAVLLRFIGRKLSGAGWWYDDWVCLTALVCYSKTISSGPTLRRCSLCHSVRTSTLPFVNDPPSSSMLLLTLLPAVAFGFGSHPPDEGRQYIHNLYFELLAYNASLAFFKYALLLLYVRIFPSRWLKVISWCLGLLITIWMITIEFMSIFRCDPLTRAWMRSMPGSCISLKALFLSQSIPTILFDLVILVLPIPLVWEVQLPTKAKRLGVVGMFLLGGL